MRSINIIPLIYKEEQDVCSVLGQLQLNYSTGQKFGHKGFLFFTNFYIVQ
jgi:hypothetical protein